MREILFRGKRADTGEWVYGSFIPDLLEVYQGDKNLDGYIKPYGKTRKERLMTAVLRETVGQYTGLTDKNGVKIFEGDIVQTKYGRLCSVDWFESNSTLCFDLRPIDIAENLLKKAPDKWDLWHEANLEVIGNIHDNLDLLIDRHAD